ncbi:O-antigen ligase family protein [Bacillus sp. JJ1566]|uniref:O-antigen ligase family protein n=1 Tax=Bacillus sp. JJ1566 TaxID=3122961 RepID=UPI002FFEA969
MKFSTKDILLLAFTLILVALSLIIGNKYVGIFVVVVLSLIALYKKELGLYMLLLYVPVRPFLTSINPGLKIISDLIIFSLLIRTIYENRTNIKSLLKFDLFEIALFIYLAIGTISGLITGVSIVSIIFQIRAYILLYFVYYVVKRMMISQETLNKISILTFITAVIISLHGFIEKISDKTWLMPLEWQNWGLAPTNQVRVYGLLKGPNELALYLIVSFLISLYLLKVVKGNKIWLIYIGLSIIGATFVLTYSRGASLALITFLLIYLVLFRTLKGFKKLLLIAGASCLLFFGVTSAAGLYEDYVTSVEQNEHNTQNGSNNKGQTGSSGGKKSEGANRFKEAFSEDTVELSSQDGRIYYVTKAIEVFKDYPIIGAGFGTFGGAATLAYSSPIYKNYGIQTDFYSDNQYILTLAETGIIGVLILSVFVFSLLFITIMIFKRKEIEYSILALFFFITMIVGGLVYNILEIDTFMMYYFLLLGIIYPRIKEEKI